MARKFLPTKIYAENFFYRPKFSNHLFSIVIFGEWLKFLPVFITADYFVPTNIFPTTINADFFTDKVFKIFKISCKYTPLYIYSLVFYIAFLTLVLPVRKFRHEENFRSLCPPVTVGLKKIHGFHELLLTILFQDFQRLS